MNERINEIIKIIEMIEEKRKRSYGMCGCLDEVIGMLEEYLKKEKLNLE